MYKMVSWAAKQFLNNKLFKDKVKLKELATKVANSFDLLYLIGAKIGRHKLDILF